MSSDQALPIPPLKNHIILVSRQALPSVLGACLPGAEPSHIHAVVTPTMRDAAKQLRSSLNDPRGRKYAFSEYFLQDNVRQDALYTVLNSILDSCEGESVGVNLTGGTKLMALAASEWAYAYELPAFYIDTAGEQVIQIGKEWKYAPLPDVLTVRALLTANGYALEKADTAPVPSKRRDVLVRLLEFTCEPKGAMALGRLNRLAENAAKAGFYVRDDGPQDSAWEELLSLCREAGTVSTENGYIFFSDEEACRWCNGIWLEEYVKMNLYRLKAERCISDFASSVSVRREGVQNELDALFSVRNRLFTIECKTANMSGMHAEMDERVPSILYKADSLHDRLGGVFTRAMLCSVRPLKSKDLERAREMGVRVICGRQLLSLSDKLMSWSKEA